MNKEELIDKLIELYTDPNIPVTAAGGIFAFTYGDLVVDVYKPTELMNAASKKDERINKRYEAELGSAFNMYRYFRAHPDQFVGYNATKSQRGAVEDSYQLITYGAPGTGKSFNIDKIVNDKGSVHFRTTFHPDSDYASFVGCYKPVVKEYDRIVALGKKIENAELDAAVPDELRKERKIEYTFVEQAFTKAYVAAWKNKASAIANGGQAAEPVYLIIEEINRGNCAQVFGDIFQLLDREGGFSKYPICADDDLHRHLEGVFKGLDFGSQYAKVQTGEELVLPDNLYIWATMNTSDQSLFPMDSAFKRRWDWEYVPISEGVDENTQKKLDWNIVVKDVEKQPDGTEKEVTVLYSWWQFLQIINTKIYHLTDSEDKELGYFFAKPDSAEGISAKLFVNKVVFYLWTDVYKNYGVDNIFKGSDNGATTEEEKAKGVPFRQFFDETGKNANTVTLKNFFKTIGLKAVEEGGLGATALP